MTNNAKHGMQLRQVFLTKKTDNNIQTAGRENGHIMLYVNRRLLYCVFSCLPSHNK